MTAEMEEAMSSMDETKRIGWIGVGRMGFPLVSDLIDGGCDVTIYNRTRSKAEPLAERGARLVATRAESAGCDRPPPPW